MGGRGVLIRHLLEYEQSKALQEGLPWVWVVKMFSEEGCACIMAVKNYRRLYQRKSAQTDTEGLP